MKSRRRFSFNFSDGWINVPVADRKVVGCTASFKRVRRHRIELSQVVLPNPRFPLIENVVAKFTLRRAAI